MDTSKKLFLNNAFSVFVNYFCSLWIGLLVEILLLYPIEIIFELSVFSEKIVRSGLETIGMSVGLAILFFKTGYKEKKHNIVLSFFTLIILFLLQHIICYSINFYGPHFASSAQDIAQAIFAPHIPSPKIPQGKIHLCLVAIQFILYLPISCLSQYFGQKRRNREINELYNKI